VNVRGRRFAAAVALALGLAVLAACGSSEPTPGSPPTLNWYVGPDRVDAAALAKACSTGAYSIKVKRLPADVNDRHDALVRRLAAKDTSIDVLSLDSEFTAEFGAAQFLAPVPDDLAPEYSKDIVPTALAAATYEGSLVAAPWWFDPQLLWFRGNTAERAGLDTTKASSWDDLISGANRLGVTVQIEDLDGTGLAAWVNALVVGGGGKLVDGPGRHATVGLDSGAGQAAAGIAELYRQSHVGPGPSKDALAAFAAGDGGFLLAPASVISDPALAAVAADMGWAPYPVVGTSSIAPLSGVELAVPLYAPHSDLSYQAISCLTSATSMSAVMTSSGHSASRLTTYDDPSVASSYPMAAVTKAAVASGQSVPVTPYWHLIRNGIDETWTPLKKVTVSETPAHSQQVVRRQLAGELP
jgi:multiple sugar transport system substrate-binding protein